MTCLPRPPDNTRRRARASGIVLMAAAAAASAGCSASADRPPLTFGVTPADHDASFPIGARDVHALERAAADGPISCASCHGSAARFSDVTCVGCHEHAVATMNAVHAGLPEYRPDSVRCLTCHPRGTADVTIDEATHSAEHFPIDAASAHAPVRCSQCHTDPTNRSVVGCTGCHEHEPGPMHDVHGTIPGYAWDSPACLGCHARAENPGRLEHTFFPASPGTKHEGLACADCHASRTDRSEMACATCHEHAQDKTDAEHAAVPDYTWDSGSCLLCHRQSQVPGLIDHTSLFPIAAPATHALGTAVDNAGASPNTTITCASCHTNPDDRSAVGCLDCHAHAEDMLASTHSGITGYAWTTTQCLFCHPAGEATGLIEHPQFPITANATHDEVACNACHASPSNRSVLLCTSCHAHTIELTEPAHHNMPGFVFDPAACITCHDQAQVPGRFDHEPLFPLALPSQHAGLSCRDCHANPAARQDLSCTSCHVGTHDEPAMAQVHQGMPDYSWSPASCVGCHPRGTAEGANFTHPFFPIAAGTVHEGLSCADCHTTPGDNTQVSCTTCHLGTHDEAPMQTTHAGVPGFAWSTAQCLFCHPNAEPTGSIDHERYFPIAAPAVHAAVACTACHVDAANRAVLGCADCHANDTPSVVTVHAGIPGFVNDSATCLQCHPRAQPTGVMDHSPYFPIATGTAHGGSVYASKVAASETSCTACHESRTDRTQNNCAACHAGIAPTPATSHGGVNGFSNTSADCKACHADAQVDRLSAHTAISPRHEGADCVQCHRTFRTDKPFGIDFDRADCVECHVSTCTPSNRGPCD